jgi:putative ABC transport system permease protein
MTESFLYVSFSGILAVILAFVFIKPFSAFLFREIEFGLFTDIPFLIGVLAAVAMTGLLAGIYPSLVLSRYSHLSLFETGKTGSGVGLVRQALSIVQFTILTGLIVSAYVIYSQAQFGIKEALGKVTDPIAILNTGYNAPFKQELLQVSGVKSVAYSIGIPQWGMGMGTGVALKSNPTERNAGVRHMPVDVGFLELYGLKPVAGRFFSEERAGDIAPENNIWTSPESLVINETAARRLGFDSPHDAVGAILVWSRLFRFPNMQAPPHDAQIIGVVEDFQIGSVRDNIVEAVFYVDRGLFRMMCIRIDQENMDETLKAIDNVWAKHIKTGPIQRYFFDGVAKRIYLGVTRQAQLLGIYACVAVFISILGLVGLAHFVAEKSTREIGIRKVLGGSRVSIVRLLLWRFLKPVLLSNILALPIAYIYLSDWLTEFERQIQLHWWIFAGAGTLTLLIALGTVFLHAFMKAGIDPVLAIRTE